MLDSFTIILNKINKYVYERAVYNSFIGIVY